MRNFSRVILKGNVKVADLKSYSIEFEYTHPVDLMFLACLLLIFLCLKYGIFLLASGDLLFRDLDGGIKPPLRQKEPCEERL